jgi:Zn-finger nucleic acid-binding protein
MMCKKCKVPMKEMKRSYHKRRKWVCPRCGAVRFQEAKKQG